MDTAIWGQNGAQGVASKILPGYFQHRGSQRQGKSKQEDVVHPGVCSGGVVGDFPGEYLNAHSRRISFRMNVGTVGGLRRSSNLALVVEFDSWRYFLKRAVVLTTKEKVLFRRMTMPVIWARVAALFPLRTLGLWRIGVPSLAALLIRSEAERCCFSF